MDSGTVVEWCVGPGDRVHRGDVVAAVDTDKAVIDVECFEDGVVGRLLVGTGQKVPVGTPIAEIVPDGERGAGTPPAPRPGAAPQPGAVPRPGAETGPGPGPGTGPGTVPRATPLVRRLADHAGVDLTRVAGTGPGGTVTRADVETVVAGREGTAGDGSAGPEGTAGDGPGAEPVVASGDRRAVSPYARRLAAERGVDTSTLTPGPDGVVHAAGVPVQPVPVPVPGRPGPAAPAGPGEPAVPAAEGSGAGRDRMRDAIAARMTRSAREIPQYHVDATIELGLALDRLHRANRDAPVNRRIVPAALLLRAAAHAARTVPELNGHWVDGNLVAADSVDLGIVVSLRTGGLLVPTVPAADRSSPAELMGALRGVVSRARTGRLRSSDTVPATITVSDLGETGADSVHGVIFPPQVALVGFGAVARRPWADGDLVGVRPQVVATVTGDHRATDGVAAGRFLHALDAFLHDEKELP